MDQVQYLSQLCTIVMAALIAKAKKRTTCPQMSFFLFKLSVKQWRSEKGGHNFHIFFNRLFIRQNYFEPD